MNLEDQPRLPSTLESIETWHKLARPTPTQENFNVQLGCHFEEICEMMESLQFGLVNGVALMSYKHLKALAQNLKTGNLNAYITDRKEFADSLGDQIVTGVGVGYLARMNVPEIAHRVNESNWTKFVDGVPQFDANGKIAKPATYQKPDLTGTY